MLILNVESIQNIGVETLIYRMFRSVNNAIDAVRTSPHPTELVARISLVCPYIWCGKLVIISGCKR